MIRKDKILKLKKLLVLENKDDKFSEIIDLLNKILREEVLLIDSKKISDDFVKNQKINTSKLRLENSITFQTNAELNPSCIARLNEEEFNNYINYLQERSKYEFINTLLTSYQYKG